MPIPLTRRGALHGLAAAAGTLLLGTNRAGAILMPGGYVPPAPFEMAEFAPFAWLEIGPDGVLLRYAAAEMGQGVSTALPQIMAEELELDWAAVRVAPAPLAPAFVQPRLRERDSAGSRSVRFNYDPLRRLGAAARTMLVGAAAARWGVDPGACEAVVPGEVLHRATGRRLPYAALAAEAARLPPPAEPVLKNPSAFRLIGRSVPRKDIPAKVDGSAVFAIDIALPGLLTATAMQCPRFGGRLARLDEAPAMAVPGVREVLRFGTWFAVVADGFWAARRGLEALSPVWEGGSDLDSAAISARLAAAGAEGAPTLEVRREGDAGTALAAAARRHEAVYEVPYLAHLTMEPMSAVARVADGGCEIWAGTQRHSVVHDYVARLLDIPRERVTLHTTYLGGGFGRRFEVDYVGQAVLIARRMAGRPVKLIWTREEDTRQGFYRPATWTRLAAALDPGGRPTAWTHRIVAQSLLGRVRPYAVRPNGLDVSAVEGAANHPYAVPNQLIEWSRVELPVPVGAWRSVGSSQNAFVTECFVDELAHLAGDDPVAYRRMLLGPEHPRHRAVLDLAAERAGWGSPLGAGAGRGIAVAECFGGWCAQVAEVEPAGGGRLRVRRIVAAMDCGFAVNPSIVEAQVQSAVVYGLSAALTGEITLKAGAVEGANFDSHPILRIDEIPRIEVHILPSREAPGGVGEVATPPVAPAVANAVFAATGRRLRSLPLVRHGVV